MSKDSIIINIQNLIEEASAWFTDGPPEKMVDSDYTRTYYWGLEDEEKYRISYQDFHEAVFNRVNELNKIKKQDLG